MGATITVSASGHRRPRQLAGNKIPLPFKRGYLDRFERSWLAKPGAFLIAPIGSDSRQLTVPLLPDSRRLTRTSGAHPQSPAKGGCRVAWWPFTFTAMLPHDLPRVKPTGRMASPHGVPRQVMISLGCPCSIVIAGPVWQGAGYSVVKRW